MRLLLEHFALPMNKVNQGRNDLPGIVRLIFMDTDEGKVEVPFLMPEVFSLSMWWEALVFFYCSYRTPEVSWEDFLENQAPIRFSSRFQDLVYWAMSTFESDVPKSTMDKFAIGAARAYLVSQLFVVGLLFHKFDGDLPSKLVSSLTQNLATRVNGEARRRFEELTSDGSSMTFFTADYGTLLGKLADGAGSIRTSCPVKYISRDQEGVLQLQVADRCEAFDEVIVATPPAIAAKLLDKTTHGKVLQQMDSGGRVRVRIVHAKDLPYSFPPPQDDSSLVDIGRYTGDNNTPSRWGLLDISQVSSGVTQTSPPSAGWLSIGYPVLGGEGGENNQYEPDWMTKSIDVKDYPWVRPTSAFAAARRQLVELQGHGGIHVIGQSLTGVNKACELQLVNALNLCRDSFGVLPPWGDYIDVPLVPDANDEEALEQRSPIGALQGAVSSLIGSFLLSTLVDRLGTDFLD